jgi:hypothetical protein
MPISRAIARSVIASGPPSASSGNGASPRLTYRVRAKKSIGMDGLRERLLREGAPHVVAADEPPPKT